MPTYEGLRLKILLNHETNNCYSMNGSKLSEEEFMYMHFHSRHMMVTDNAILAETAFKIMGDGFYRLEVPVTKKILDTLSIKSIHLEN